MTNILLINCNNKDTDNFLISLICSDFNNIQYEHLRHTEHYDSLHDEIDCALQQKDIIDLLYIENVAHYIQNYFNIETVKSALIYLSEDFLYVLYYNQNVEINNKNFNLIATILATNYNPKSNVMFGSVFFVKLSKKDNSSLPLTNKDIKQFFMNSLYVQYYTTHGIPGLYIDNKPNFNSILFKTDDYHIFKEHNLVCIKKHNKELWAKYDLHFNLFKDDQLLDMTDKLNMLSVEDIQDIFSWNNISHEDLIIINKLKN